MSLFFADNVVLYPEGHFHWLTAGVWFLGFAIILGAAILGRAIVQGCKALRDRLPPPP